MGKIIRIHPKDNAAVALESVSRGEVLETEGIQVTAREDIPRGHKIALVDIPAGAPVLKYGTPIGSAIRDISAGEWLHTHNVRTNLSGEKDYVYDKKECRLAPQAPATFSGYMREDGRAAVRNEIWIVPTVGCVNGIVKRLAEENQDLVQGSIDGIFSFTHPYGCSQTGEDHARTRKLLADLVRHPNAGAVLVVSLGCENLTHEQFLEELGDYSPERVKFLTCQKVDDEFEEGRRLLEACAAFASHYQREEITADHLVIGMKCGGSDGLSGITANPTVGAFSDLLCAQGGTTILTEVPEMFGAEGMLLGRCESEEVFARACEMLNGFKRYFIDHGEKVYENPSPGNREGGITTLEDKSCGCVQKGGTAPIVDILEYGDTVKKRGLNLLSGPGNDLVSSTALTAAGAHIILFTTGRGTPFGAPVPTIKIATNSALFQKKSGWMDFNAGTIADGTEGIPEAGKCLMDLVLATASGKHTHSEENGYHEIAIFKGGVTL